MWVRLVKCVRIDSSSLPNPLRLRRERYACMYLRPHRQVRLESNTYLSEIIKKIQLSPVCIEEYTNTLFLS